MIRINKNEYHDTNILLIYIAFFCKILS